MDRQDVLRVARSWLGTPWVHQGRLKGVAVDCVGFVIGVAVELRLVNHIDDFPRNYGPIPDGERMFRLLDVHMTRVRPLDAMRPGDILLFRFSSERPQHLGILADRGYPFSVIHAYATEGRVVEHNLDEHWRDLLIAAFRLHGVDE